MELLMRKSECDFFKCMRLTKKTFQSIIEEMTLTERFSATRPATTGTAPTSSATALAATLWYLGNLSAQCDIAQRFQISQGHLSFLIKDVVDFLCGLADSVIHWLNEREITVVEQEFRKMAQFPGLIGPVDGCHVPILAPDYCQNDYLDRNHTHSVNLMAICDSSKKFTYCFAGYAGSDHDQRVFSNSAMGQAVENSSIQYFTTSYYHIVGDSAFQLQPHVMVPYKDTGSFELVLVIMNRLVDNRSPWATQITPERVHQMTLSGLSNPFNRYALPLRPTL